VGGLEVPTPKAFTNKSLEELKWGFLELSQKYKDFCFRAKKAEIENALCKEIEKGENPLSDLYSFYGDIASSSFEEWWKENKKDNEMKKTVRVLNISQIAERYRLIAKKKASLRGFLKYCDDWNRGSVCIKISIQPPIYFQETIRQVKGILSRAQKDLNKTRNRKELERYLEILRLSRKNHLSVKEIAFERYFKKYTTVNLKKQITRVRETHRDLKIAERILHNLETYNSFPQY
jgi:hypothetical protein